MLPLASGVPPGSSEGIAILLILCAERLERFLAINAARFTNRLQSPGSRFTVQDLHEPQLKVKDENVGTLTVSVILPALTGSAARWVITRTRRSHANTPFNLSAAFSLQ